MLKFFDILRVFLIQVILELHKQVLILFHHLVISFVYQLINYNGFSLHSLCVHQIFSEFQTTFSILDSPLLSRIVLYPPILTTILFFLKDLKKKANALGIASDYETFFSYFYFEYRDLEQFISTL